MEVKDIEPDATGSNIFNDDNYDHIDYECDNVYETDLSSEVDDDEFNNAMME